MSSPMDAIEYACDDIMELQGGISNYEVLAILKKHFGPSEPEVKDCGNGWLFKIERTICERHTEHLRHDGKWHNGSAWHDDHSMFKKEAAETALAKAKETP